jgi:transposase
MNLLNLPDWNIEHVEDAARDYRVHATYGPEPSACVHCGKGTLFAGKLYRHGTRPQLIMDLPAHGKRVGILLTRNRYRCRDCGKTFLQPLPDVDGRSQMTRRLVRHIEEYSVRKTFTAVADEVGVDEKTVRNLFRAYVERLDSTSVFDTPEWMGVDEVRLLNKPRAVFTNIKERTIIAVLEERTKKAVLAHLKAMPDKDRIKVVTMGMWNPYYDAVREVIPDADIIIDKFHVVRMASAAVEKVRKSLRAGLEAKTRRKLTRDRFILLRRNRDLKPEQRETLALWSRMFPTLATAYKLKEDFYDLWLIPKKSDAIAAYEGWRNSINGTELTAAFRPVLTAMRDWKTPIFAYWDHRATDALTEATNGVAKMMRRAGRGYSFEAVRAKMLYSPTIQKQPQHRRARYGAGFDPQSPGRFAPSGEPPLPLGTDLDALLRVLEQEQRESKSTLVSE